MKKHSAVFIVAVVLLLMLLPVGVSAENAGTAVSDFEYVLQPDGSILLENYIGESDTVLVPDSYLLEGTLHPVVLESKTVFSENTSLVEVTLSPGVGFQNNSMAWLFYGCTSLQTAVLSGLDTSAVTDLSRMFAKCEALSRIEGYTQWDTSSVLSIAYMFHQTKSLKEVDLRNWDLSGLKNSGWCFQLCGAESILLPDNLAVISAGFLNHASKVKGSSFVIPAGVKRIGYAHTLYDFATASLTEILVAAGNTNYKAVDGILYSADGKEMLAIPRSKTFENGVYEIPEGVEFLGELSFSRNYNVKKLLLPDSYRLAVIKKYDPAYIVYQDVGNLNSGLNLHIAVYCYTGVTQYAVKESNPWYKSHEGVIYSKDMTALLAVPTRYDRLLQIPEGVITWEEEAMWCAGTTAYALMKNCPGVTIPSTMLTIPQMQIDKLNWLERTYRGFTIKVSKDNPNYHTDAQGQLQHKPMIGDMTISFEQDTFVYDGTAKEPLPEIRQDQRVLELGKDYVVEYADNIAAGTATVTITAKGDQCGSTQCTFTILPAQPDYAIPVNSTAVYGQCLQDIPLPAFFTWNEPETLVGAVGSNVHYADYWNQDPNYARVERIAIPVEVAPKVLQEDAIWVRPLDFWSCERLKPAVRVTDGDTPVNGEEYRVEYKNNFWCGRGTAILTDNAGGSYAVSGTAYFWIIPGPFFWAGLLLILWCCTTGRILRRSIKETDGKTGHDKAGEISQQGSGDGVAGLLDSGSTEVNADGVEGCLGGTQHDSGGSANQRVHPVTCHQLSANSKGSTTADGPDQNKNRSLRRNTKKAKDRSKKPAERIHSTGRAEHVDGGEQQDQCGDQTQQ